ncbi:hypothetical protein BC941DRAFT_516178 [Chlamydoabsidia padenii]|nr:hypothetical protein BC941DRAFT_516178 [Chlamydoabsidia padenii]
MAPSSFTENLIYSSQGRLPGSNMNENHRTMRGLSSNENNTSQYNQVNPTGAPAQETQRSVVGQQPYGSDYQPMQSSSIDTSNPDNFGKPKQLDYDPDPATKSAFQNVPKPISTNKNLAVDSEDSVANSLDSNRAIINEPLASDRPIDMAPSQHDTMPATYQSATNSDKGPLDKSGMTFASSTSPGETLNGSFNYGRRRSSVQKRRGSTPDSECMAALPVLQSYVPYAQGVAVMSNHEARFEDDQQQAAASNRRYSLHNADEQMPDQGGSQNMPTNGNRRRSSLTETISKLFHRRGSK